MNMKINKYNFKNLFPYAPFKFETIMAKAGHVNRVMRREGSYNTTKFLYIDDIIHIMEKRLKENKSPNQHHMKKWKEFLENDIQEYLDNLHERDANET